MSRFSGEEEKLYTCVLKCEWREIQFPFSNAYISVAAIMKYHGKEHIKTNEEMLTLLIPIQSSVAIRGLKWNTFCVSDTGPLQTEHINTHITWIQTLQRDLWAEVFAFMKSEWMCAFGRRSCGYHFSCFRSCLFGYSVPSSKFKISHE